MKKVLWLTVFLFMVLVFLGGCTRNTREPKADAEILVSAAASLKDALEEIKPVYENKNPGVKLVFNLGSSGTLQQQIEQGSPVHLFISAGKKQMDTLEEKKLIKEGTRTDLLGNQLVLITGKNNQVVKNFADLVRAEVKHIGIGNPESVPAGKYAKETLISLKLWDAVPAKLVEAKDVRQVLTYVETGNAEAGLVYQSDTVVSEKVKIVAAAPFESHSPIIYPAAVIGSVGKTGEAEKFLEFLRGDEAMVIFTKFGFQKK